MRTADDGNGEILDGNGHAMRPCVVEFHAVDGGHEIDTARGDANLEDRPGRCEVFHCHSVHRCAEAVQRAPDSLRIVAGAANPDVKIARCSGMSVGGQCVRAHDQELNPLAAQGGQHVFEVRV